MERKSSIDPDVLLGAWLSRYVSNEGNADVIRVNLKEIDAVDKQ